MPSIQRATAAESFLAINHSPGALSARRILYAVVLAFCFGGPPHIHAQATIPVPLEDRTYEVIDRLSAQLPLPDLIHDQRPYTRRQVAQMTLSWREAIDGLAVEIPPFSPDRLRYLDELVSALEVQYAEELALLGGAAGTLPAGVWPGFPVRTAGGRFDASLADSPFRGFTWNGLGGAENALVNPLLDYGFGRPLVDGASAGMEAATEIRAGNRLVAITAIRWAFDARRGDTLGSFRERTSFTMRSAALRLKAGRWAFQVGRAPVRRGQGRHAGLLFSDNAPPLDMVLFENEEPGRLPWIFRHLGPTKYSLLFADLGADQNFPHAKLYSNWLTFRPAERFELGGGFIVQDGGEGSPEQSTWERIGDYLIFVDILFQWGSDFTASNKIAGMDFRWWAPGGAAVVYGELMVDDFRIFNLDHVREMLWPDAAHIAGVVLPRLDGAGRLSAWAELQHNGIRIYRHYAFRSGVTRGRFLLGSGMGSDAHGIVGGLDFAPSPASTVSLEAAWERLSHDEWSAPDEPQFHFELVTDGPEEKRGRVSLAWDHRPLDRELGWQVELGLERVENFGFRTGETRNNAAVQVSLEWARPLRPVPARP
jgi:hypothetical protein